MRLKSFITHICIRYCFYTGRHSRSQLEHFFFTDHQTKAPKGLSGPPIHFEDVFSHSRSLVVALSKLRKEIPDAPIPFAVITTNAKAQATGLLSVELFRKATEWT